MPEFKGGTLYIGQKAIQSFDKVDVEWAARMLYGEAGGDAHLDREGLAVLWCMLNRLAMLKASKGGYRRDWIHLIRSYSQPINPIWMNGGKRDPDPGHKDERELRREAIIRMKLADFPAGLVKLVQDTLGPSATIDPPSDMLGLVHFYSPCFYYARKLRKRQRNLVYGEVQFACTNAFGHSQGTKLIWSQPEDVNPQGNAFYRIPRRWDDEDVRIEAAK